MHPFPELLAEAAVTTHGRFFQFSATVFLIQIDYLLQWGIETHIVAERSVLRSETIRWKRLLDVDKSSSELIVNLKNELCLSSTGTYFLKAPKFCRNIL